MKQQLNRVRLTAGRVEAFTCPAAKPQAFLWDTDTPALAVRVTPTGRKTYVFESRLNGVTIRVNIGTVADWPIEKARTKASELKVCIDTGIDPREIERKKQADRVAEQATSLQNKTYTLEKLLNEYCDYLKSLGRISHSAARSIFKVHVFEPWPKVAALPANQVTGEQIADMMRKTIEAGKDRTANKLRSYIRAAYQVAKASRSKASIPLAFKAFNVKSNPAGDTEPDESANRADKRPFTADELKIYWQVIKPMPGFIGAVLRLHLLTGGQRIEQLSALLTANVTPDSVTLFDGKGRPGKAPRPHTVPLIPAAAAAMQIVNPKGPYALSMDGGKSRLGERTLSDWAKAAGAGIADFQAKRIRSGVETLLASKRITSDIRGRLQSHGISGVQARHYDGHDYLPEKREALETLFRVLEGLPLTEGKVVQLRAA
jgi:integrase